MGVGSNMTVINILTKYVVSKSIPIIAAISFALISTIAFGLLPPPSFINIGYLIILMQCAILCVLLDINNNYMAQLLLQKIAFYKEHGDITINDIIGITNKSNDNTEKE